MRVLHVHVAPQGAVKHILPIARTLIHDGWVVDVACPPGPQLELLADAGVGYVPLEISRGLVTTQHVRTLARLILAIRRGRYELVHLHGPIPGALGRLAARVAGVGAIYHCRGTFYEAGSSSLFERLVPRIYPFFERVLARWTEWTFTLNSTDAEELVSSAKLPRSRLTCLGVGGCGLDLDHWDASRFPEERRREYRRRMAIPEDQCMVGFVGRTVREKGVFDLLEAFATIRQSGVDAHLLLVGGLLPSDRGQGAEDEFESRFRDMGLASHITRTGLVDDPSEAIAAMDVLVLPSYREGFGQVLAEAAALGVPVVAAASRGAREAVVHEGTGLLVPIGDTDALARAMLRVLADPELRRAMGQRSIERARRDFGSERVLHAIADVYRQLRQEMSGVLGGTGD